MSEKRILIQEYDENPCLSCTNDCKKYPCEAKQQWVLGAGHKGPEKNYKRSEIVQIMADAIQSVAVDRGGIDLDDDTTLDPRMVAEAALNALLEG